MISNLPCFMSRTKECRSPGEAVSSVLKSIEEDGEHYARQEGEWNEFRLNCVAFRISFVHEIEDSGKSYL